MNKNQELLAAVTEYLEDKVFACRLENLVVEHRRLLASRADAETFISRLLDVSNVDSRLHLYAQKLQELQQRTTLTYSETQWVPNEYEALEQHGLVHCRYGAKNSAGLSRRTLELTEAGRRVCVALQSNAKAQLPGLEQAAVS